MAIEDKVSAVGDQQVQAPRKRWVTPSVIVGTLDRAEVKSNPSSPDSLVSVAGS
jgi:hypothetical protein